MSVEVADLHLNPGFLTFLLCATFDHSFSLAQFSYFSKGVKRTHFLRLVGLEEMTLINDTFQAYSRPSVNICCLCLYFVLQLVLRLMK